MPFVPPSATPSTTSTKTSWIDTNSIEADVGVLVKMTLTLKPNE